MYTRIFDSVTELGEAVQELQNAGDKRREGTSSTDSHRDKFYGGLSMEEAIEKALAGGDWQEGADAMPRIHVPHETLTGAPLPEQQLYNNVQGFAPNVPAYLANTPDNMMDFEYVETGTKLLRVAVHVGRIYSAEQSEILNRGAAIIAVLDQLQGEGYSLEVWAVWRNNGAGEDVSIETCIKHGTDHWAPRSVAFALAHAAFQRRLCWRLAESATGRAAKISIGYGRGDGAKFPDFDLSFGYVLNGSAFSTPEKAVRTIKNSAIAQLAA